MGLSHSIAVRGLLGVGVLTLSGAAIAGTPLFTGEVQSAPRGAVVSTLARKPETLGMRVVNANAAVVSAQTREIELDLGTRRVNAVLDRTSKGGNGSLVWAGTIRETSKRRAVGLREVRSDEQNSALLVRRGNTVTGSVRMDGKLFRIRPLPDGSHAVVEVDETRMPPDHSDAFRMVPEIDMAPRMAAPNVMATPMSGTVIRVQVVATSQAINAYGGDMAALVDLAVAETNQGYANSGVGITLELANYATVNYTSAGDGHGTDLARFRGTSDGYMDGIHASRDANAADVNVLVIDDGGNCGLASSIGSTAATAFATVHYDCATGYYSFGHEIGHLQSARHDPAADPTNSPYAYGHGYRAPNNAWRTIMAYNCSPSCPRLNYWSNPNKTYNGSAMGTTTRSHNQRVLDDTKATIAAFRGGTPPLGQTYSNGTDYTIRDRATVESPITVSGRSGSGATSTPVAVNIVHTYKGDLKVDLVAPDGSVYTLHNRSGGSADNINQTFNVNLANEALNGTWKLRVNDNASGDTGYVNSWSITF